MERDPLILNGHQQDEEPGAPWLLRYRCSEYLILAAVFFAIFTDTFFYGVIIPALPFMLRERCNIPEEDIQFWASTMLAIFGMSIVIGSPVGGWCADNLRSRKIPFYTGLAILAASTILFGTTTSVWMLILSRVFFGFSSAIVYTVGLALLIDSVNTDKAAERIGLALTGTTIGITMSPLLGGYVYAKTRLTGILGMMVGLVVLDVILRLLMIERGDAARWLGSSVLPKKMAHVVDDEGSVEEEGTTKPKSKKVAPMLRLLQSGRVWADLYGLFMNFGVLASFDAVLPLFVRQKFSWSSTEAGLIFLNIAIPSLLGPVGAKLAAKFGPRRVAIAGCITCCPALICLRFVKDNSREHIVLLCALLVLVGLSLAMVMSPIAADLSFATDKIEEQEPGVFGPRGAYGQVYALFNMAMAGSTFVGPAIAGALREKFGWGTMNLVLGLWCISTVVPVFFMLTDDIAVTLPADDHEESGRTRQ